MKLYSPAAVNALREKYNFRNTKSLGQNFIVDKNIIDNIIDGAGISENDIVIEIGPGMGVLTAAAAEAAAEVIAVEIDSKLIPILNETLAEYDNIEIINDDILETDLNELIEKHRRGGDSKVHIIGNLPYYITTPIIMKILEKNVHADRITVMMQKEVAERIVSEPGRKTYGALSVAVGYYCSTEIICIVPANVFIPAPKVDSAVLRLEIRKEKPVELASEAMFFECIKSGFAQRRKTLSNSLLGITGADREKVNQALKKAGIDSGRRAETLTLEEFACLSNEMYVISANND